MRGSSLVPSPLNGQADGLAHHPQLSDDEDNFHPNIDNNLMIRLQREKRQQREKEEEEKKKALVKEGTIEAKEEMDRMEKQKKLHVGNICKDKYVSKHEKSRPSSSAEPAVQKDEKVKVAAFKEDFVDGYEAFLEANRAILLEYAAIDEDDEASEQFVLKHTQLLSEHATGFYLLHCINLQAEGKTREMRKTARQYLLLTYVCDLAKSAPDRHRTRSLDPPSRPTAAVRRHAPCRDVSVPSNWPTTAVTRMHLVAHDCRRSMPGRDARDAIRPLFKKMLTNQQAAVAFEEHLEKYIEHVKTRAEVKKQENAEALANADDEDTEYVPLQKGEHVGPGGLDPAEVFETLPEVLQQAFGERDVDALKAALATMSTEDAQYHMKRCVDSGLWDPAGGGGDE